MNSSSTTDEGRRTAMTTGMRWAAGIAICTLVDLRGASAAEKLAKSAVQYQDVGNSPGKDCDDCTQFIAGKTAKAKGTCKIVEGDIDPHGHCIAFTPIAKK
jgi:hypothetical protein